MLENYFNNNGIDILVFTSMFLHFVEYIVIIKIIKKLKAKEIEDE